jgi:hypothetical protein
MFCLGLRLEMCDEIHNGDSQWKMSTLPMPHIQGALRKLFCRVLVQPFQSLLPTGYPIDEYGFTPPSAEMEGRIDGNSSFDGRSEQSGMWFHRHYIQQNIEPIARILAGIVRLENCNGNL